MTYGETITFSQKVIKSKSSSICLYKGQDITGRTAWYFILLLNGKKLKFASDYKNDIDIAEYGKVIISGYGKKVPEETLAMMKEQYDFTLA